MNPSPDPLHLIHRHQAARQGVPPLSLDEFGFRLRGQSDADLTQLLPAGPADLVLELRVTHASRFALGRLCVTPKAADALPPEELFRAVARHARGDWGLLQAPDRQQNEEALRHGGRLVSMYPSRSGQRLYVITEASRDLTIVLLPEEY